MAGTGGLDSVDGNVDRAVLSISIDIPQRKPTVPFLMKPTDMERAEASSRWTCDSVVRGADGAPRAQVGKELRRNDICALKRAARAPV